MITVTLLALGTLFERLFANDMVVMECRNCGESVDEGTEVCPHCEADEIARYDMFD